MRIAYLLAGAVAFSAATLWCPDRQTGVLDVDDLRLGWHHAGEPSSLDGKVGSEHFAFSQQSLSAGATTATSPSRNAAPPDGASDPIPAVLVKVLQTELKRVGCYSGAIDGDWSATTRRAMDMFLRDVNSVLPTEHPDVVLLTFVQSATTAVCTPAPNPTIHANRAPQLQSSAGQKPRDAIPNSAQGRSSVVLAPPAAIVLPVASHPTPPIPGRMTAGGPIDEATAQVSPPLTRDAVSDIMTGSLPASSRPPGDKTAPRSLEPSRPRRDTSWTGAFFDRQ